MALLPEGMGLGGLGSGLGSAMQSFEYIIIGLIVTIIVGSITTVIVLKKRNKKKFNIPVIIITPRSDGKVVEINRGLGGYFKSKKVGGITSFRIKRKGIGIVDIPPPLSSFLSSPDRTLILAQKGVDDYEPVMPNELAYVDTFDGQKHIPILKLKAMNQDATAWNFDNLETAKKRFTFLSVWEKYQVLITLMTFVLILFIIIYINWIGMKDVVAGLKEVADTLRGTSAPVITKGG